MLQPNTSTPRSAVAVIAVLALLLAASPSRAEAPSNDAIKMIVDEGNLGFLDWPATLLDRDRIAKLYGANGYRLMWSEANKTTAQATALLQQLKGAADRGLDPNDYPAARLDALLAKALQSDAAHWALFDVGLSLATVRFLADLHYGRIDPSTVGHNLNAERNKMDFPEALTRIASAPNVAAAIDAVEPPFTHYVLLKRQLARYRALAAENGLTQLPRLPAKAVKPGDPYGGAPQLQRLLLALGDETGGVPQGGSPPGAAEPAALTPPLTEALRHYQGRHGEKPDGVLGAATYGELTKPLSFRVRQIELTLERWRWLPSELESAPIIVNIPEFRLFAFESTADAESKIRQMDVIVGKAFDATQTPVFSADMAYLIFRPYWEIPYDIAVKEIVPAARSNPAAIDKHQMEIVRASGDSATVLPNTRENVDLVASGSLRLRQKPGPDNSLGLVKFMLPNPHNVYLHSTPAQSLFAESRRDFSHGCVRVADPVGLAEYVLRDFPEWTREKILAAMDGPHPVTVTLKHRIPVFFVYGTALAKENGDVLFFDDIYGHDQRLEHALEARRPRKAQATASDPGSG